MRKSRASSLQNNLGKLCGSEHSLSYAHMVSVSMTAVCLQTAAGGGPPQLKGGSAVSKAVNINSTAF